MGATFSETSTDNPTLQHRRYGGGNFGQLNRFQITVMRQIATLGPDVSFISIFNRINTSALLTKGLKRNAAAKKLKFWDSNDVSIGKLTHAIWALCAAGYVLRNVPNDPLSPRYNISYKGSRRFNDDKRRLWAAFYVVHTAV